MSDEERRPEDRVGTARPTLPEEMIAQYLLEELKIIEAEIQRLRSEGTARLNFLLTLVSAAAGAMLALATLEGPVKDRVIAIGAVVSALLALFAIVVFGYIVGRDIATDRNMRATGRIRQYFIAARPEISRYLSWQTSDAPTRLVRQNLSSLRRLAGLISVGLAGLAGGLAGYQLSRSTPVSVTLAAVLVIADGGGLHWWVSRRLAQARTHAASEQRFRRTVDSAEPAPDQQQSEPGQRQDQY